MKKRRRPNSDALNAAFDRLAEAAVGEGGYPVGTAFVAVSGGDAADRYAAALKQIAERGPDTSSVDQWAFFPTWAKRVAQEALTPPPARCWCGRKLVVGDSFKRGQTVAPDDPGARCGRCDHEDYLGSPAA